MNACNNVNKNKKGQTFFKTRMISKYHLERNLMPEKIITDNNKIILMPKEYKKII